MTLIIADRAVADRVISARAASKLDRWDEVWDGDYFMAPAPNNEHSRIATRLAVSLDAVVSSKSKGEVYVGPNVSDRDENWTKNYRVPDVAVYLNGNPAEDRKTHWLGGPDLAVEIVSEEDRTYEKIPFYASLGTRELLIIDRNPWMLTIFQLQNGELTETGISRPKENQWIESAVVSLSWRLTGFESTPTIEVRDPTTGQVWQIDARAIK